MAMSEPTPSPVEESLQQILQLLRPSGKEANRCTRCGRSSLSPDFLRKQKAFVRSRWYYSCPSCQARQKRRLLIITLLLLSGPVLMSWLGVLEQQWPVLLSWSGNWPGAFSVGLGSLILFLLFVSLAFALVFALWCHELAHALAAWLMGLRDFQITVGTGPVIWACHLGSIRLEIKAFPVSGFVRFGTPRRRFYRFRVFFTTLAGPLVNAVLLAVSVGLIVHFGGRALVLLFCFTVTQALFLFCSLIPVRVMIDGQKVWSDGPALILTLFLSEASIRERCALYYALEGGFYLQKQRPAEALRWYQEGLVLFPNNFACLYGTAYALVRLNRFQEAKEQWLSLFQRGQWPSLVQAMILDAVATADLLLLLEKGEDPDLLEEAARFSGQGWALAKGNPELRASIKGTCGGALIEGGKLEEGKALLEEVCLQRADASLRGWCACLLALAADRQGDATKRAHYLEAAQRSNPSCPALPGVMRRLESGTGRKTTDGGQ